MRNKGREIILRLLADGKISVEEADELLDAVEGAGDTFRKYFVRKDDAARTKGAKARAKRAGKNFQFGQGFNFDFDFPWEQEDWQWPWEQEGWQWPWEQQGRAKPAPEFEVPGGTQLKIRLDGGDLSIRGTDEPSLLRLSDPRAAIGVTMENETVNITLKGCDLGIEVPANVVSMDISLRDGAMIVDRLKADLVSDVAGGDVIISEATGAIQASVTGGAINLKSIGSAELEMQTDSGDILLDMPSKVEEGSVSLSSDSGDISLVLPSDSQCQILADAPGGQISHALPPESAEIIDETDVHLNVKLNGGGADFVLSTRTGDVNVKA